MITKRWLQAGSVGARGILLLFFVVVCGLCSVAFAGEIQYARLKNVRGSDLFIQYTGPGGTQNFVCDAVTTECELFDDEEPVLFPDVGVGEEDILYSKRSPNGHYELVKTVAVPKESVACPCDTSSEESGVYVHTLYDVSGEFAEEIAVLPYTKDTVRYKFSWMNGQVVLFGEGGEIAVYDIASTEMRTITVSESGLSYHMVSPHAKYLAAYHSVSREHRIWDTHTGVMTVIPAAPSGFFAEFSYDEMMFSFLDERGEDGVKTLYIADLANVSESGVIPMRQVFEDDFTIADYIFLNDGFLYVVGNTSEDPYNWVLYRYDPSTEQVKRVQEGVSYGGWIRQVGDDTVQFLVIEGKNTHVALYNAEADEVKVVRAVDSSPASEKISREVIMVDGVYGVLYKPKSRQPRRSKLFVWLHGGPIRQTSFGYHSYTSYANFDELLERLTEAGSYVLKVDFAGSYGYGREFTNSLESALGLLDVEQVVAMTRDVQKAYRAIDDTYLIGLSYGGYLAPKVLIDYQKYFDGAIAVNGVFDWLIWLEEHPAADSFKRWFGGLPNLFDLTENFELYKQASIVRGLPDLRNDKTLLLIYGENDRTIPPAQTREFFYLAKSWDKDVRLLKIEDEGHIIQNRKSLNLLCRYIADELKVRKVDCGEESVEYENCTELVKDYPNGVDENHPAYRPRFDRDKDGFACEQ